MLVVALYFDLNLLLRNPLLMCVLVCRIGASEPMSNEVSVLNNTNEVVVGALKRKRGRPRKGESSENH